MTGADAVAPVVTVAALYGASSRVLGPRVAERLDVPVLDRDILTGVAAEMRVPERAAAEVDAFNPRQRRGAVRRYFEDLGRNATSADGSPMSDRQLWESRYRSATDGFLARASVEGGVVLGRGGAVVQRAYGIDPDDSDLYHLWIDATALDLHTCTDLVVTAARSRAGLPAGAADPSGSSAGAPK